MLKWLQRIAVVIFSVVVALGALEVGLRLFWWKRLTTPRLEDHPIYHHRLDPHATFPQQSPDFHTVATTNNLGLRGPADYGPKPAGATRLLMLGDSFTFGVGVNDEETFCALLQGALDRRGRRVEVINAGLGSYSPILDYLALRDLYLPLEPDAVILWFDFGDLQDDFFYARNLRYDAQGEPAACHPNFVDGRFNWRSYLGDRSALVKYFNNKLIRTYQKIRILGLRGYARAKLRGERAKAAIAKLPGTQRGRVDPLHYDRLLMIRDRSHLAEIQPHWERTASYLVRIRNLLAARGIPFALAAYPYGTQVGPDQWGKGREAFGFASGVTYDDPFAFELLEAFARAHGIPFLNTYAAFVGAREQQLFYDWDGHFTPAGHRVVADYLQHDPATQAFLRRLQ
ncbi:MAG: SGNH/GDSL hydrolase family protein [Candidatus Omnitrophica bacterium]|nr:SGNH/GDSL hydrolase family protein [Candidatus Omnitrophota bacterium]